MLDTVSDSLVNVVSRSLATMLHDGSSTFVPQNIGILLTLLFFTYVLVSCSVKTYQSEDWRSRIKQLSALFFTFLVRYLTGNVVSERVPTVVSIVALTVASLPTGLVPIDVFIVGYMKNSTGQFQPWASDSRDRHDFSTTLLCAYYGIVENRQFWIIAYIILWCFWNFNFHSIFSTRISVLHSNAFHHVRHYSFGVLLS